MKKKAAIISFLLGIVAGYAQNDNSLKMVVSADNMNILYVGVDNPVSIAVPGIPVDRISAKIDSGEISGANGKYVVRVNNPGQAKISVFEKMRSGESKLIGISAFRIKKVEPVCYFVNRKGDAVVSKAQLMFATRVMARFENFDINLHYDVLSFDLIKYSRDSTSGHYSMAKAFSSNSGMLTDEMKNTINDAKSGDHLLIQNVHIKGPEGERTIPGVNLVIQ